MPVPPINTLSYGNPDDPHGLLLYGNVKWEREHGLFRNRRVYCNGEEVKECVAFSVPGGWVQFNVQKDGQAVVDLVAGEALKSVRFGRITAEFFDPPGGEGP